MIHILRTIYAVVGESIVILFMSRNEAQAIRDADALAEAEENIETWEPAPADAGDPAGASPAAGERSPQPRPAAGHLTRDPSAFDRDAHMAGMTWPEPKAPEPTRDTSAANAERIRDLTDQTSRDLLNASISLTSAVKRAESDYSHNSDRLRDALAALRLVQSVVSTERYTWAAYGISRARHEQHAKRGAERLDGAK